MITGAFLLAYKQKMYFTLAINRGMAGCLLLLILFKALLIFLKIFLPPNIPTIKSIKKQLEDFCLSCLKCIIFIQLWLNYNSQIV